MPTPSAIRISILPLARLRFSGRERRRCGMLEHLSCQGERLASDGNSLLRILLVEQLPRGCEARFFSVIGPDMLFVSKLSGKVCQCREFFPRCQTEFSRGLNIRDQLRNIVGPGDRGVSSDHRLGGILHRELGVIHAGTPSGKGKILLRLPEETFCQFQAIDDILLRVHGRRSNQFSSGRWAVFSIARGTHSRSGGGSARQFASGFELAQAFSSCRHPDQTG